MAQSAVSIGARIRRLELAEQRAAALPRKERLASRPMCELLGVSWPVLRGWCDEYQQLEAKGAVIRGGNGIEWEFDPRKTISSLLAVFRRKKDRQDKKSKEIDDLTNVKVSEAGISSDVSEKGKLLDYTIKAVSFKERMGGYTDTQEFVDFTVEMFGMIVSELMSANTQIDPNGRLPPDIRSAIDDHQRLVAAHIHQKATEYVELKRASIQSG